MSLIEIKMVEEFVYRQFKNCQFQSAITTNCRSHLKNTHQITFDIVEVPIRQQHKSTIQSRIIELDKDQINEAVHKFIVQNSLPLSIMANPEFY
jgi:hypothetical protein